MLAGTLLIDKNPSSFDHKINAPLLPRQVEGIAIRKALDVLAIDNDRVVGIAHFRIADVAQHGVVLEQVGVRPRIGGVVKTHHLDARIEASAEPATHEVAANAAESVDRYAQGHGWKGGKTAG